MDPGDRQREKGQPVDDDSPARCVDHPTVQLGGSVQATAAGCGHGAAAEQLRRSGARDPSGRDADDAMAGEAGAHREVEPGIHGGKSLVEAAERGPHAAAHDHPAGGEAEEVVLEVVLGLVQLVFGKPHRAAETGHGLAERGDDVTVVPAHQLRAGDRDRWGDLHLAEEERRARRAPGRCRDRAARAHRRR